MNARQRQIQRTLAARRRQVARVLGEEGTASVRAAGASTACSATTTAISRSPSTSTARGSRSRAASCAATRREHPSPRSNGLMEGLTRQLDAVTESARCGTAAWDRLRALIAEERYGVAPSDETELSYKGIPVMLDSRLPADAIAAIPGAVRGHSSSHMFVDEMPAAEWSLKSFDELGERSRFDARLADYYSSLGRGNAMGRITNITTT
jgi:hypothetical protein